MAAPARSLPTATRADPLATLRTAAWLGWQVEANWTQPLYFIGFSILRPLASVLILVFMYYAVSQVGADAPIFAYIFLGNAFYIYVGSVMSGASYSILDDREHYRVLKYLVVAPISMPIYLLGRAVARFFIGTLAVLVTLGVGVLLFDLPLRIADANWPLFLAAFPLGIIALVFMGITLGAWTLSLRTEPWFIGEGTAAALYLFSGAIFPVSLLPSVLQPIAYLLPITYWLELLRRALLGPGSVAIAPTLARFSDGQILAILAALTLFVTLFALTTYRHFDHRAREAGMIDSHNNF